ncbi:MAG: threonine aldolase [Verrucomicrobia bacterium RIFCSPHIGHO2_12_FULL_41_10]|nr:MAG: threonine aldolase [Verrucomicrobia bacterium RIFCSPHIGHO2_12_FULL_41_10]
MLPPKEGGSECLLYLFLNDYSEGAHPNILDALSRTNLQQERGYGTDSFAQEAEFLIKEKINKPEAKVHFVSSGTQANLISLACMLKSYESVIAAESGHIAVHEAGAIEATGHKVNVVTGVSGKVTTEAVMELLALHTDEHMVKPRVVYISQSTELGTIYSKQELQNLHEFCREKGLYLFLDGARLGHALMAKEADFNLQDIANCCDVFTIGGTKNGALLGEAIVIVNRNFQENFRYHLKQRGALLAKGRVVAIQFIELFKKNFESCLYFANAQHANFMAEKLAAGIRVCGYEFLYPLTTNQIFPIFPNKLIEIVETHYGFYVWSKIPAMPDHSAVRLVTSWATTGDAVEAFLQDLKTWKL